MCSSRSTPPLLVSNGPSSMSSRLRDRSRKTVARGGTGARYLPSGHLIYTNASTMFAVPFDLDARETRGTAVPVLNDIAFDPAASLPQYDISADGTLVYRATAARGPSTASIVWLDATGKRDPLPIRPAEYPSLPRLSPDGKRLALTVREGGSQDIWIYDTERDQRTRLTFGTETFAGSGLEPRRHGTSSLAQSGMGCSGRAPMAAASRSRWRRERALRFRFPSRLTGVDLRSTKSRALRKSGPSPSTTAMGSRRGSPNPT